MEGYAIPTFYGFDWLRGVAQRLRMCLGDRATEVGGNEQLILYTNSLSNRFDYSEQNAQKPAGGGQVEWMMALKC